MNYFVDWKNHTGSQPEKFYKTTLWQGEQVMVGMNCLDPGQTQAVHAHEGADKFYLVLQGEGKFTVGDEEKNVGVGTVIVAPSGIPHGVKNIGGERLSVLVAIAPPFK